jgi:hypothetical protein
MGFEYLLDLNVIVNLNMSVRLYEKQIDNNPAFSFAIDKKNKLLH